MPFEVPFGVFNAFPALAGAFFLRMSGSVLGRRNVGGVTGKYVLLNLLTYFPVESPARLETSEGRNGVPSVQIHETRKSGFM